MTSGARGRPLPSFGDEVATRNARGELVVQPRMGFADPDRMRRGLLATRAASAATAGTITLDSYTRVGDHDAVRQALTAGAGLNGYPMVDRGTAVTVAMLRDVLAPGFPVQVRHGSADPRRIVTALLDCGLDATEGGPVSYCLPYSRHAARHFRGQLAGGLPADGRREGARPRAAPGDVRRLHDGATVPARHAGGAEPA